MPDIQRHLAASQRLMFDDLDWDAARAAGLTADERAVLEFFTDIEGQTVFYMLELAKLDAVARQAELMTFLTMWNYEEHFHSVALARLLRECGGAERNAMTRACELRANARWKARIEDGIQRLLAMLAPRPFLALWMTWGASQELLTTRGYEELGRSTANPVLAELCKRIAKQERRHFAYYFQGARERLAESRGARRLVRFVLERSWSPVGSGVKTPADHVDLVSRMFKGDRLTSVLEQLDARLSELPGLSGVRPGTTWGSRIRRFLPAPEPAAMPA
ncbi:MAG TPA: acyl-ACP desaturase [Kofleriaceae bacterium]|nr:acyl-ACP desaturase [Kofleriaceae bacterium]